MAGSSESASVGRPTMMESAGWLTGQIDRRRNLWALVERVEQAAAVAGGRHHPDHERTHGPRDRLTHRDIIARAGERAPRPAAGGGAARRP